MAKLSVIICVYNTNEKLFDECLYSIFESTIKDLEVIVVDDGSTVDYSNLEKKYKHAKFVKTENKGTLSARMLGANLATAPYVCYVDSDDTVSFDYFEGSLKKLQETDADMVINDWAFWTEKARYVCERDTSIKFDFLLGDNLVLYKFFRSEGREHSYYVLWNKIFKRELLLAAVKEIEKLNIKSKLVFAEDTLMTFFAFSIATRIANTHLGFYFYRIHGNQEITVTSETKLKKHISSMAFVFRVMEKHLKKIDRFDDVKLMLYNWKSLMASTNFVVAKNSGYEDLFEQIKKAYGVTSIARMPKSAELVYAKHKLLPLNIEQIDTALKKVYYSNKLLKVYAKKGTYTHKHLVIMKTALKKKFLMVGSKSAATLIMPKEISSIKIKILHNEVVYKIGMILFPKGSKIRQKLKSKL